MTQLEERLERLVKTLDKLPPFKQVEKIKEFIKEEIGYNDDKIDISIKDLATLHSNAVTICSTIPIYLELDGQLIHHSTTHLQALCYAEAVFNWLRLKGRTVADVNFRGKLIRQ